MLEWMGLNFYYYDGLQLKIRAGIIIEHECIAPFSQYLNFKIKDNSISASTFHHRVAHSMMKCGALSL